MTFPTLSILPLIVFVASLRNHRKNVHSLAKEKWDGGYGRGGWVGDREGTAKRVYMFFIFS